MLTKAGLNAEGYFITNSRPKTVIKLKAYFVENLPVNSVVGKKLRFCKNYK